MFVRESSRSEREVFRCVSMLRCHSRPGCTHIKGKRAPPPPKGIPNQFGKKDTAQLLCSMFAIWESGKPLSQRDYKTHILVATLIVSFMTLCVTFSIETSVMYFLKEKASDNKCFINAKDWSNGILWKGKTNYAFILKHDGKTLKHDNTGGRGTEKEVVDGQPVKSMVYIR